MQTSESRGRTCSWSVHGCVPTLLVVGWERKHVVLPVSLLLPMKTCKEAFLPTWKNVWIRWAHPQNCELFPAPTPLITQHLPKPSFYLHTFEVTAPTWNNTALLHRIRSKPPSFNQPAPGISGDTGASAAVVMPSKYSATYSHSFNMNITRIPFMPGLPNLQNLVPDDLRWGWCNNNRNKVHDKCHVLESSRNHPCPRKNCLPWNLSQGPLPHTRWGRRKGKRKKTIKIMNRCSSRQGRKHAQRPHSHSIFPRITQLFICILASVNWPMFRCHTRHGSLKTKGCLGSILLFLLP